MSRELASKIRRGLRAPLAIAALVTATAIPLTANAASSITLSPQCTATHRVLNNDSWTRLAARFKVPQARLLRMNGATFTTPLFVGNKVCISTRSTKPSGVTPPLPSTPIAVPSVAVPTAPIVTVAEPAACRQVQVSWRGASPDTGYYSLQWVRVSASGAYDFGTYTMMNVRGTSTALPTWLNHGVTYALRVFAMRADWEGIWHSNQNVTPHSAVVTFTVPTCNTPSDTSAYSVTYEGNTNSSGSVPVDAASYSSDATVTVAGNTGTLTKAGYVFDGWCTTQPVAGASCGATARAVSSSFAISSNTTLYAVWSPLACADGGLCAVGDTGPGGGVVFYVHDDADDLFTSTGSDCATQCRYLEAAPSGWKAGELAEDWCNVSTSLSVTGTAIGTGMANTTTADTTCTSKTIQEVATYSNNSKTDWFLPSKDELNELCKFANQKVTGDTSVACSVGTLRSGFLSGHYWSSSEAPSFGATHAWSQDFSNAWQNGSNKVPGTLYSRAIRAVAPSCEVGGVCAVGDTGPGGGVVFYVHDDADDLFTSTGSDCGTSCRYLEAALSDSSTGIVFVTSVNACYEDGYDDGNKPCTGYSVYSNSENQTASRATSELFGQGMTNTNKIYSRATTVGGATTSDYGVGLAWAYSNNGKTDWFLPSKQELNELCKYARQQTTGDTSVACTSSGSRRSGFANDLYWSSSEGFVSRGVNRYRQDFLDGNSELGSAINQHRVRIIRAIG